ncbi:hypothetical protein BD410DRAFT_844207 [Rickenella mellea]|uniref:PH domain-containing protein n=1 Tax=Rickenella mellea TaxID=50990 RepID=A0A4Y7PMQ4_9AGAM|nr:hypothetical protein BD410DRAFT_844207 [Rickenella mellea]
MEDSYIPIQDRKQHPKLWFDDGNIILTTNLSRFRVHRGFLSMSSPVFADMLSMPQPDTNQVEDVYDGLPVVEISDNDTDFTHLLRFFYDHRYYQGGTKTTFEKISGLLRLSTKYQMDYLRNEIIDHLSLAYPSTLENYMKAVDQNTELPLFPSFHGQHFAVVALARETGAYNLLPTALWRSMCMITQDIVEGITDSNGRKNYALPPMDATRQVGIVTRNTHKQRFLNAPWTPTLNPTPKMPVFDDGDTALDPAVDVDVDDPGLLSSAGDMRMHLQLLLDAKEKQLQQAGTLGQRVLAQQMELEERIRQLQDVEVEKTDDDEVGAEMKMRYRELASTLQAWDEENVQLSSAFASKRAVNGIHPSPTMPINDLPPEDPSHAASGPTPAQSSRRAKNAAHRANDVEFAFEIGSSLLTEVRRLQSLLGERDKAIQDMKEEKDDLEKAVEGLRSALRTQQQQADEAKEANWNLEVTLQDLRAQLSDQQSSSARHESESKRLTKALATSLSTLDSHKTESERLKSALDDLKAKHETDVAQARKHAAGLARDKSDLQTALDKYKAEVARAGRRLPRFGSPSTPGAGGAADARTPMGEDEDLDDPFSVGGGGGVGGQSTNRRRMDNSTLFPPDVFGSDYADSSPDPSPSRNNLGLRSPSHPANEIEALQQKLAHAQRQIGTLKGTLAREKELRMEYRRKLAGAGAGDPTLVLGDEEDDGEGGDGEEDGDEEGRKARVRAAATPARVVGGGAGRGRGRGRMTLAQKLGIAANTSSPAASSPLSHDEYEDHNVAYDASSPPRPHHEEDGEEEEFDGIAYDADEPLDHPPQQLEVEEEEEVEDGDGEDTATRSPQIPSNRTSVDGMDPAFANVLRRTPSLTPSLASSTAPATSSPLRQSILARSSRGGSARGRGASTTTARGGTIGRRNRGGAAYQEPRPSSLIGQPEALAAELGLGDMSGVGMVGMDSVAEDMEDVQEREREYGEFGCQTEDVVEPPKEKEVEVEKPAIVVTAEKVDMGVQAEPVPEPEPVQVTVPVLALVKTHAETQTDTPPPPPAPEKSDMVTQTDPVPVPTPAPVLVKVEAGTETETSVLNPTSEVHVQTLPVPVPVMGAVMGASTASSPRRTTLTQADYSSLRNLSAGDSTIRAAIASGMHPVGEEGAYDDDQDGEATERGSVTETDMEDYHDARERIGATPTPSESLNSFHSISTMTDNDYPESSEDESDQESIKASQLSRGPRSTRPSASASGSGSKAAVVGGVAGGAIAAGIVGKEVSYESQAVSTDALEQPPVVPQPEREMKESAMQTDEWMPPAPAPAVPTPPSPTHQKGFGLYRVGSSGQQFQFISPPPSAPATSSHTPIPIPTRYPSQISSASQRDSNATIGAYHRFPIPSMTSSRTDRRMSIESTLSSNADDVAQQQQRPHTQTVSMGSPVDKTRPPMMVLPPPPKMPPPASSMPPPNFIPERKRPQSTTERDVPPPRPTSPPPPELIHRATTPTIGGGLTVPGRGSIRQHGSSLPPMSIQSTLRQPSSTTSFRSAANAAQLAVFDARPRLRSTASLLSDQEEDVGSRRSSMSSDHFHPPSRTLTQNGTASAITNPVTPSRNNTTMSGPLGAAGGSTDPAIIHAITQTMIGEFLYKYTRKAIGKGHGERRHKRFFWVHPYTKTLYWSSADPGSSNVSESSAKSAYIDSVRSVLDPNPMPPGLYQYSVVIATPQREMKITAPTKERHDIWLNALQYLLARPTPVPVMSPGPANGMQETPPPGRLRENGKGKETFASPQSQRSAMTTDSWNITPRGQRSQSQLSVVGSVSKRSGTPAAEYLRWADGPGSPTILGGQGFEHVPGAGADDDDDDLDFEIHDSIAHDPGFDGLENVRACCDGKHTVGRAGHTHDHHHHHHQHHPQQQQQEHGRQRERVPSDGLHPARPVSPSWSFRSRASSTKSSDGRPGTGSLFGRFGTRRSRTTTGVSSHE